MQGVFLAVLRSTWVGASVLALACSTAAGAEAGDLAARFGSLESIEGISLSPDGTKLALIMPVGEGQVLAIADMVAGGAPKGISRNTMKGQTLTSCSWPTNTRLICRIRVIDKTPDGLVGYSRLVAMDSDGTHVKMVTDRGNYRSLGFTWYGGGIIDWNGGEPDTILMTRQFVPEATIGTHLASSLEGIGVERVNVETLRREIVERPRPDTDSFISDGMGHVRIMGMTPKDQFGYDRAIDKYFYRKKDDRHWEPLSKVEDTASGLFKGFDPVAVDPALNAVYGFDSNKAGRTALYREKLDGSGQVELVLGRDDVDVDEVLTIGRQHRVVGASYATDRRQVEFFDPALKKLGAALTAALPGKPEIDWVDSSEDEKHLLLLASSDVNPGMFYLFDKTSRHLEEVLPLRPQLAGMKLAPMKPVSFPASDGTMIPGYLTLPAGSTGKGLPAIVMPHGGPSARDEWGFDWLVQYFAAEGFAVLQPNYRGSAGYGADWYQKNGFQSWRTAIGDVDDAGRWLVSQGIAAADRLAIVGWSYGGYAALQSGVTEPGLFKAIVAIAPVTDLEQLRADSRNYTDYRLVDAFIGNGPHVAAGSPAQHADAIAVPVLMFHGDHDLNVNVGQSQLMAGRLEKAGKQVEYVEFPDLDHQLASPAARTRLLSESNAFLRKALGMPAR